MTDVNQMMQTLTNGGVGNPVGVLAQKLKGVFPIERGETIRNRQILRVNKGDQQIFFYATTLRKRKR